MKLATRIVPTLIFMLLLAVTVNARAIHGSTGSLEKIDEDYLAGQITIDQKAELVIQAIKTPQQLPTRYLQAQTVPEEEHRMCPTMAIRDIMLAWEQLSPETQQHFSEAFARPSGPNTYLTPDGKFTFHYNTTGSNAVPTSDTNGNTIPDFVERCAAYLDTTLTDHLAMGYYEPPPDAGLGGDNTFDIYFENMGNYGYAVPEGTASQPWNDYYSYLVLNNTFLGFPANDDPEGDQWGAAKVTIAHEFHHCIQFAYDATEYIWYMELDATYMEDIVFNLTDDNYNYLSSFFSSPQTSLMTQSIHMYSCFTWGLYLSQKFDTSLNRAVWEGAKTSAKTVYVTLSDTLLGRYGWTQDSAFADYAVWNYITGVRNDGLHHAEAANYPLISIGRTHSTYPALLQSAPSIPGGYAANYIHFLPGVSIGKLRITVDGNDSREWKFYIVKSSAENMHDVEEIVAPGPGYSGFIDIPGFESYLRVALVAVNLSEFASGANFTYSAEITPPYAVASNIVTDSAVYSGWKRNFVLHLENPSVLPDIYSVFPSDGLGWVELDTFEIALVAGQDTTISVEVAPPQGTPLGTHSTVQFISRSWGDPQTVDTQTTDAVTYLQRGDEEFNGRINILDVNYLVSYLFAGGATPVPVAAAADVDCNVSTNILDVTYLVQYLFGGGLKPPCNPY